MALATAVAVAVAGPLIPAVTLGARAGRQPLPGAGRQLSSECIRAQNVDRIGDRVAFAATST
jgi:hypothetical protein